MSTPNSIPDTTPTTTTNQNLTPKLSTHQTITIRHAKFSDLWPAAKSLARAFSSDSLFGDIIHPRREQYPSDPALWFYQRLIHDWLDRSQTFLVATTTTTTTTPPSPSQPHEIIAGVAQWTRFGLRPSLLAHSWAYPYYDPRCLLSPLLHLLTRYILAPIFRRLNRALDPSKDNIVEDADSHVGHFWSGPRHTESFLLHLLGVDPAFQNRGVGRDLVAWGMRRGREEGVSVSVVAAEFKDTFYQRCGFRECVGNASEGEGNPLGVLKVPGGNVWFRDWDGEEQEEREREDEREGVVKVLDV